MIAIGNERHRRATVASLRARSCNFFCRLWRPSAASNRRRERRRANAGRAWQCTARSTDRCPASCIQRRRSAPRRSRRRIARTRRCRSPPAHSAIRQRARLPTIPSAAMSSAATPAMPRRAGREPIEFADKASRWRSPNASAQRPAMVVAAFTDTCWPSTARTASSKPSNAPGTRSPGRRRTTPASIRSCASSALTAVRRRAQVEQILHAHDDRADHRRERRRHLDLERAAALRERHAQSMPWTSPIATVRR